MAVNNKPEQDFINLKKKKNMKFYQIVPFYVGDTETAIRLLR